MPQIYQTYSSEPTEREAAHPKGYSYDVLSPMPLPQELWDAIMHYLGNDRPALKACSLTCRAWRPTTRMLFWRTVSAVNAGVLSRLQSLLRGTPDIVPLVRLLHVTIQADRLAWLATFTQLDTLVMRETDDDPFLGSRDPSVHYLPDVPWLPNLTSLTLRHEALTVSSFVQLLTGCPRLSTLVVGHYATYLNDLGDHAVGLSRTPLSLPHLRRLESNGQSLIHAIPIILRAAGTALESLKLDIQLVPVHVLLGVFDFSHNTRLTDMEVATLFCATYRPGWGDQLAAALAGIGAGHTSLKHVALRIPSIHPAPGHTLPNPWDDPGESLGRELSRVLDGLPNLTVAFHQWNSFSSLTANSVRCTLERAFQQRFPGLYAHRERLRFTWDLWPGGKDEVWDVALLDERNDAQ